MKRFHRISIALVIVLVLVAALALSGCEVYAASTGSSTADKTSTVLPDNQSGTTTETTRTDTTQSTVDQGKTIVTYVTTSSTVYSSTAEVVNAVADTVVEISTETVIFYGRNKYIQSGAGSGVIVGVSEAGSYYVITNNHVIAGASEITVRTRVGKDYSARLVATDDSADIAVVAIDTTDELHVARMGNSDDLQIGEDLIAIGNPLGSLGGTVTKGILSATGRTIQIDNYYMTLLQTDTAINPGNSGGGLFNMKGDLIGVVNAKTADEKIEGICFAIPINIARSVYQDLIENGYIVGRATLNLEVSEGVISYGYSTSSTLVYVTAVGDTANSNFMLYDRIYKINGEEITSLLDYNTALMQIAAGDSVQIEVYRGSTNRWGQISFAGETTTFTVTAGQYGA